MFQIDALSRTPVYLQLIEQTERLILSGVLPSGAQIPSVRSLSIELSVNPNTIQKAYSELDARGLICAVPGRGCFVTPLAQKLLQQRVRSRLPELGELLQKLKIAGVGKDEILQCVQSVYGGIPVQAPAEPNNKAKTGKEWLTHDSGTITDQKI